MIILSCIKWGDYISNNIRKVGLNMLGNFTRISEDTINGLKEIILSVYKYSFFDTVDNFEANLDVFMKNTQITLVEKETVLSVLYQIIIFNKGYLGDNYQWSRNISFEKINTAYC